MPRTSPPAPSEIAHQLALPLGPLPGPIAAPVAMAHIPPARILAALSPSARRQMRATWVRVLREVIGDGRDA